MAKPMRRVGTRAIFNTRAEFLFHSFFSAFYPVCWPGPQVLIAGVDGGFDYSVLLEETVKALEHELHGLQRELRLCPENKQSLGLLARDFPKRAKKAVQRIVCLTCGDLSNKNQRMLIETFADRLIFLFHGVDLAEVRINQILDEEQMLGSVNEAFSEFGLVSRPPYFRLSPEHGEQTGQVFFNSLGECTLPHWLTFHIALDSADKPMSQVLLRFVHFYSLRTLILHELISHCAFQDLSNSGHDLRFVESCGYISHGWLMYYAYAFAQLLLFRETQEYVRFHRAVTEQLKEYVKNQVRNELARIGSANHANDATRGFKHAEVVYEALGDASFLSEIVKYRSELIQGYSPDRETQEIRVVLLIDLLVAIVHICREDQSIDAARKILECFHDEASFAVPRFADGNVRKQLIEFFRCGDSKKLRTLI